MRSGSRRRSSFPSSTLVFYGHRVQPFQGIPEARPQRPQPLVNEPGRKAPPHQEEPQTPEPPLRLLAAPLPPVPPGHRVQGPRLRELAQRLLEPPFRDGGGHAPLPQAVPYPMAPLAPVRHAATRETRREGGVVQVTIGPEPPHRPLHFLLGITQPEESPPQLRLAVVPSGQPAEGALVGGGRALL